MDWVYEIWYSIFSIKIITSKSKTISLFLLILCEITLLAQNSQFFWYPGLPVKNWENYYSFWNSINLLSVDVAVCTFGYINEFIIFEIVMIGFIFSNILFILLMNCLKKSVPKIFLIIAKVFFVLLSEIFFIPSCILFFVIFKYSKSPQDFVDEYPNDLPGSKVNFGIYGEVLAVAVIVFVLFIAFIYETCNYDIRYPKEDFMENRKIHAKVDYIIKLNYAVNSYFFTNIQLTNYYAYLCVALLLYTTTTAVVIYYVPYYSKAINYLKLWSQLSCMSTCFYFWLGFTLENSGITFLLSVSTCPIIAFFSYSIVNLRLRLVLPLAQAQRKSFEKFELSLRNLLKTSGKNPNFFKNMKKNFKISESRLIWVLQAYFSLYNLNNCSLALTKISLASSKGFNIPDCYQVFKCRKIIQLSCTTASNGFKILKFFKKFRKTKEKDYDFCKNYIKFFNVFLEKTVSLTSLKLKISSLVKNIEKLKENYKKLNKRFPDSAEVKDLYGSLLTELLNNHRKGKKMMSEAEGLKSVSHLNKNSEFCTGRCNFVVSLNDHSAKLIYFNKDLLNLLRFPLNFSEDLHLSMILPKILSDWFLKISKDFTFSSLSNEILKNHRFYLVDKNGFLIECIANIENISSGFENFFWFLIDPVIIKSRGFAILNESGQILEHSEKFKKRFKYEKVTFKGLFIQEFIEGLSLESSYFDRCIVLPKTAENDSTFYILKKHSIMDTSIVVLYFTDQEESKQQWEDTEIYLLENQSIFISKTRKTFKNQVKFLEENQKKAEKTFTGEKNLTSKFGLASASSSSSSNHNNLRTSKEMKDSLRAFKISKYLTTFTVGLLICIFAGIMGNAFSEINEKMKENILENIQRISYSLESVGFMLRTLEISQDSHINLNISTESISQELEKLKSLNEELLNLQSTLKICKGVKDRLEEDISYWEFSSSYKRKTGNPMKVINFIVNTGQNILKEYKKNKSFTILLGDLVFSIHQSLEVQLTQARAEFISCEKEKLQSSEKRQNIFYMVGIFTSIAILLITCCYMYLVEGNIKLLWELLRMQVKTESLHIRLAIMSRLNEHHYENEEIRENYEEENLNSIKIVNHFIRYIIRFSFICTVCIAMYSMTNYYFYPYIFKALEARPSYLNSLQELRTLTISFLFFTVESHLDFHKDSLYFKTEDGYVLFSSKKMLDSNVYQMQKCHSHIYDKDEYWFTNSQFKDLLLGDSRSSLTKSKLGLVTVHDYLIQESQFIVSYFDVDSSVISLFIEKCLESCSVIEDLFGMAKKSSDDVLNYIIRDFSLFCGFCFIILITLNYFCYHRYLNKEIEIIYNIIDIIELVPISNKRSTNTGLHFSN